MGTRASPCQGPHLWFHKGLKLVGHTCHFKNWFNSLQTFKNWDISSPLLEHYDAWAWPHVSTVGCKSPSTQGHMFDTLSKGHWTEADPRGPSNFQVLQRKGLVSPPFHPGTHRPRRENVHSALLGGNPALQLLSIIQALPGSDDHLQLPGVLDDLFGQLCGRDGSIFWLLLLAGKAVVVVEAQDPPSLQKGKNDKMGGVVTQPPSHPRATSCPCGPWLTFLTSLHNARQVTSSLYASVSPCLRRGP